MPRTGVAAAPAVTVNVAVSSVAESIGSLKLATMLALSGTPTALLMGVLDMTDGALAEFPLSDEHAQAIQRSVETVTHWNKIVFNVIKIVSLLCIASNAVSGSTLWGASTGKGSKRAQSSDVEHECDAAASRTRWVRRGLPAEKRPGGFMLSYRLDEGTPWRG